MKRSLKQLSDRFGGTIRSDHDLLVTDLVPLQQAGPDHLAPFLHPRYATQAQESLAGALLTEPSLLRHLDDRPLWVHPQPRLALARLIDELHPEPPLVPSRHPTAVIHPEAQVDGSCRVEAFTVIDADAQVGPRCLLGARSFVGSGVILGAECRLGPGAVVLEGSRIGDRVRIGPGAIIGSEGFGFVADGPLPRRMPQVGGVVLEDDVEIGALTAIDRATIGDTIIRRGAKLDNLIQVGHNAEIGAGALMAAQCGLAGSSKVGAGAQLGGQVGVGDHLRIGSRARLAGKSGVTADVPDGATYAGYPALPRFTWLRAWATLLRRGMGTR